MKIVLMFIKGCFAINMTWPVDLEDTDKIIKSSRIKDKKEQSYRAYSIVI